MASLPNISPQSVELPKSVPDNVPLPTRPAEGEQISTDDAPIPPMLLLHRCHLCLRPTVDEDESPCSVHHQLCLPATLPPIDGKQSPVIAAPPPHKWTVPHLHLPLRFTESSSFGGSRQRQRMREGQGKVGVELW